jgi:hypothetical protein
VDTPSSQNRVTLSLRRGLVAILTALRRVLGSVYQVVFRDRLRDIDRQTERLGSASVEAVTHLGSEVRALNARLAAIERELGALRALLEPREREDAEDAEKVPAPPPSG